MSSLRLRSRLAAAATGGLLLAALAGPALPVSVLAASPARVQPLSGLGRAAAATPASRGRIDASRLVRPKPAAAPFSRAAVGRALGQVQAKAVASRRAGASKAPSLVLPPAPDPDLWQSSGAPVASVSSPGVGARQLSVDNEPADGSTAAGPDQVLEAVNGAIYFADRNGQP